MLINFNIEKVGSLGNAASGIIKKIEDELISANEPEEAKTFVKGDNCDNAISAETKTFLLHWRNKLQILLQKRIAWKSTVP